MDGQRLVSRNDMASMITALKYKGQNARDPQQSAAQLLLQKYHSLNPDQKQEGGIRNLQWASSFNEQSTEIQRQETKGESGYYTAPQIFQLNSLSWDHIPSDQRDPILASLLEDSAKLIQARDEMPEKKEHPTIPLLTKYLYCYQPEQTAFKDISDKASSLSSSASGINQDKLSKALGAPDQVQVKVEHPHHHALQEVLKYGQAMKGRLEKEFNTCSSLLKDLKTAGHSATATAEGQIHTGLKEVEKWLDKLRLDLHAGSTVAPDAEKAACESATQKITSFKAEGMIHQDGLKAVKQRLLSLLREFGTK